MPAATDRIEFAPPPPPGRARAFALAVLAHVLLMLALTWGITWNRESQDMSVEAELWASVPQEAAPRAVQPEPSPPVVQAPPLPPPPPAPPEPKVEAPPPPAPAPEPDIALEREKRRQEEAQRRRAELEEQKKLEARKRQEELEREKLAEARRKKEEQEKRELAERKAAAEKKRQEELAKAQELQEAKQRETMRQQQIDRMRSLADSTGADNAKGTAARSAGPTDSYAGRIRARVRPNIVFTDDIPGNPTAEIEVRMALDGTITSKRVVKSSGVRSWDEAVLRALDKTAVLPPDIDGRVHSPLIIEFRPKG